MKVDPQNRDLLDKLRWVAAVSGTFNPVSALMEIGGAELAETPTRMLDIVSLLRPDCTVERDDKQDLWLMRNSVRRKVLSRPSPFGVGGTYSERPTEVEQALAGTGPYAPDSIDGHIEATQEAEPLLDLIQVLDRAGPGAPGYSRVAALRGAVNRLQQAQANERALETGFFGRDTELDTIKEWLSSPSDWTETGTPPRLRTLHVSGLPGIGKSFLLERIIQIARQRDMVILRLDFDRSSLTVQDDHALFDELSRQIGNGLPRTAEALRQARLRRAETLADLEGLTRRGQSREIMGAIRDALSGFDGRFLILLDTLEVVRQRADVQVRLLFERLDRLAEFAGCPVCLISAGRRDSILPAEKRVAHHIDLTGLEDPVAETLLEKRGVDVENRPPILRIANGIPLRLVLASKSVELGARPDEDLPEGAQGNQIEGYLYRAILSRVPRHLRDVALKGLVLHRINADALCQVVAPVLGMTLDGTQARRILDDLAHHHWLVRRDGPWLMHRSDIRSAILSLIYEDHFDEAHQIDRIAADWFVGVQDVTALYHQLQLCRDAGEPVPDIDPELAVEFTDDMLGDLPPRASDAIRQARGERSDFGRRAESKPASDFVGREAELRVMRNWLSSPSEWAGKGKPAQLRILHVSGQPGIGKSRLLDQIGRVAQEREMVVLRLNFDRPSLAAGDDIAVMDELSRQIGNRLSGSAERLRQARLRTVEAAAGLKTLPGRVQPREINDAIRDAVRGSGSTLVILLDALEVVRSRSEVRVQLLFERLDRLAELVGRPICLISAGRRESILPAEKRVAHHVELMGLENSAVETLLERHGVDKEDRPSIVRIANGNPLRLMLAIKSLENGVKLDEKLIDDINEDQVEAYLYRRILDRVPNPLRDIAIKGLVLLRINSDVLRNVLAPVLELELDEADAERTVEDIKRELVWLVHEDGSWLLYRSDVRRAFLSLVYGEFPEVAQQINRKAAEWFVGVHDATALYHRLQLCRDPNEQLPDIAPDLAYEFTDDMLDDLPQPASDAVRQARSQRSEFVHLPEDGMPGDAFSVLLKQPFAVDAPQPPAPSPPPPRETKPQLAFDHRLQRVIYVKPEDAVMPQPVDERAIRDVEIMMEKGELREIPGIMASGFPTPFELISDAGLAAMAHAWRTGQWTLVQQIFDHLPQDFFEEALNTSKPDLVRALLEIWAEFRFSGCLERLAKGDLDDVLAKATDVYSSSIMAGCALDAMMLQVPFGREYSTLNEDAKAQLFPFLPGGDEKMAWNERDRADRLRANLGIQQRFDGGAMDFAPQTYGRIIAPLNPYATPLVEYVRLDQMTRQDGGRFGRDLARLRELFAEIRLLIAPDLRGLEQVADGLSSYASDAAEALANAGIAAEVLGAYAFFRPARDLPALADAAERWRRTVNGLWSYGSSPPEGWMSDVQVDHQAMAVAKRLDTRELALSLLWLFAPAERYRAQARRRLIRPYQEASGRCGGDLHVALRLLQQRGLPLAQSASLAALAAHGVSAEEIFS
ncbi:MAG: AAA family ATPase [Ruegeria sp.]